MEETNLKKYILKRPWQPRIGLNLMLYLGYNSYDKISCVEDKSQAKIMTEEKCKSWLLIINDSKLWSMEEVEPLQEIESETLRELEEEIIEENNNGEQ